MAWLDKLKNTTPEDAGDPPGDDENIPVEPGHGNVYLLLEEGGEYLKIGKSINIERRIKDLGRLSPRPLHLIALLDGYSYVESWFHRKFGHLRTHGEWFKFEGELADTVNAIVDGKTSAILCPSALVKDGFHVEAQAVAEDTDEFDDAEELRRRKWMELEKLYTKIQRRKGKRSLHEFFKQAWSIIRPGVPLEDGPHIKALCFHVQSIMEDHMRAMDDKTFVMRTQNLLINVPPRCLKPCWEEGYILEEKRGSIKLKDVAVGDRVLTHKGRFRNVLAVAQQGELPLFELRTWNGRIIRVAGDHPMLTQRGWVNAQDVTTNDVLAEVHGIEGGGSQTISNEEARLIGYLIGDGGLTQAQVKFTNQDPETVADFVECAKTLGFEGKIKPKAYNKNTFDIGLCGGHGDLKGKGWDERTGVLGPVKAWITKLGLNGSKSSNKFVPNVVLQGSNEVIINYLAAYWSCDGGIHDRRDLPRSQKNLDRKSSTVRIDACSISETLARQHQMLLSRLGLSFHLRRKEVKLTAKMTTRKERVGEPYVSWMLTASDQDTAAKFMQLIAPHMRHEKRTRAQNLARTDFDRVLNADPVVSVEQVGSGLCRCLQVEEDSSFVFDGVAVHNTAILTVATVWVWLHRPQTKIMYLSANPRVAENSGRMARDLIQHPWFVETYQPAWLIRRDQDALSNLGNTAGGSRMARGLDSQVTGDGADILCIDDPSDLKDTQTEIQNTNENYTSAVHNRINDPRASIRIGIMQRMKVYDWAAKRLEEGNWLHVRIPMEFEIDPQCICGKCHETNVYGWKDWRTQQGEILHQRFTKEFLAKELERLQEHGYMGQMQQNPIEPGGGRVKRAFWSFCRISDRLGGLWPRPQGCQGTNPGETPEPPYIIRRDKTGKLAVDFIEISVDAASKKTERGSLYGMLAIGWIGERFFVLDDRSRRGDFTVILEVLRSMIIDWRPKRVLVEGKAAGGPIIETLKEELAQGKIKDPVTGKAIICPIEEIEPEGDKEARLDACLPRLKSRHGHLLEGEPWLKEFVQEFANFPNHPTSDRVDSLSQSLNHTRGKATSLYNIPM